MKNRIISIGIVGLLVIGGFIGIYIPMDQVEAPGPTYVSGSITVDTTWYLADSPYIVTGDVIVDNGTTLTIEAGVTVKFDGLYSLIVNGTLNAQGTNLQPILFTSNQSVPAKGDWNRIRLQGINNIMEYCEISYGNYPLYIMGANTNNVISNCNVIDNTGDGIYLKETTHNTIDNTTVSFSSSNGITLLISEYNTIDVSYVKLNDAFGIYLRSSMNNTIKNTNVSNNQGGGIELGLSSENIQIKNVIVFENYDNGVDFGGNSYNNITDSQIIGNDRIGIDLGGATEHQRIENCIIRDNGGSGVDLKGSSFVNIMGCNISKNKGGAGIYSANSATNVTITNSEIWTNSEDGIEIYRATHVNVNDSKISENGYNGIIFKGSDTQENNIIQNCTISSNGNNGIYLDTSATSSTQYIQNNNISFNMIYSNIKNGIFFKTYANEHCRFESFVQYNNIFNNTIYSNSQNGIYFYTYIDDDTYSSYIQHNNIHDNIIYSNNQNGVYFEAIAEYASIYVSHNTIYNNSLYSNSKNGIHFNSKTNRRASYFRYNDIFNNSIHSNNQNGILFDSSYIENRLSYIEYNNLYSNTIYLNSQNGIAFFCFGDDYSVLQYNNIHSNFIYLNDQNGVYFYSYCNRRHSYLESNIIYSNTIYLNKQNGIYFYVYSDTKDSYDTWYYSYIQLNEIYSNTIYSNNQNGIYIYGNSRNGHLFIQNNYIYSNIIYFHTIGCGIYVHSDNNTVTWENSHVYKNTINSNLIGINLLRVNSHIVYINNISNNQNDAVYLDSSYSNTISYNNIADNNFSGITLTNDSNNNKIQNNKITSNNQTGIFINGNSDRNIITRNDILNHPVLGMNIIDSTDNLVHHNNFLNNNQNAFDSTIQLNDWDDSAEGNWWDDYSGFDANGDGIGDIPYDVPGGGSKDWYPIIDPANITAPYIESTIPANGDVNISVTPLISITFSNKMNRTATENAISISGGHNLFNFTWNNGDLTVTFEPSTTLSSSSEYTVVIALSAKDVLENLLEENYQFSFTTKDVVAPYILSTAPTHNSIDIILDMDIVITFSEPMNITTITFTCSPDPGGWSVSWSDMDSVATYTHDDFGGLTTYSFEVNGGKDIGGNNLVSSLTPNPWLFTTLDVEGPEITTTSPSNGSAVVLLTADVVVTFSEQMNTSSVIYSCTPDPGGWIESWTNGDKTVTYSHNGFTTQTIYTFHISAGKDMAGNYLNPSLPNPWSFTTVDTTSPMIVGTSPSNSSIDVPLNANIIVTFSEEMDPATVTFICNPNPSGWVIIWGGGNTVATYSHNPFSEKISYSFQITGGRDITANDLVAGVVPNPWFFTTQDVIPPQIISTSPANGSLDIDLNVNIVVTFSEAMNTSSLNYICTPEPGGWSESWNAQYNIVTFTHDPFRIETKYTFQINAAKDISGNDLNPGIAENPWSFTTIGDNVGPQITSTTPADNTQNVDLDTNIQVTFSEAIDPTTLSYVCSPDPGGWLESWSNGNTVVTLSHDQFTIGTTYTFYVASAKDISGNGLTSGGVSNPLSFNTIGDFVAPQIISTSPTDNEDNIDLDMNLVLTFSKPMDTSTIVYTCSPDPGGWFTSWSEDNTVFTLSHNPFAVGTVYTFQVTAGKDNTGNNLTSGVVPNSWNFTTISVNSLIVTPSLVNTTIEGTFVLIAQAYDSQNNPINKITYTWSVDNNLGTIYSQGLNIATFKASPNTGTCYVNVTAGGKSASVLVKIKSDDLGEEEPKDSRPEDMAWISFLWLLIITACLVILVVVLWKKGSEAKEDKVQIDENATSEEMPEVSQEEITESEPLPPEELFDEEELPPPPDD